MTLSRRSALGLISAAALPRTVFAAPKSYDLRPKQIASGLWMIEGSTDYFSDQNGGAIVNCALLDTPEGLIVIDSGPSLRYGRALASLARGLNPKGVTALVNTHHHPDHFFGNQAFPDTPVWALGETKVLAETHGDAFADNMYLILGDWMRGTEPRPPTNVILGDTLEIGGRVLGALPLSGHTEADLALLDRETGTLIAGDLAFLDRAPTTPSADLGLWRDSLDLMEGVEASGVIPGHGPLDQTGKAIRQTRAYLDWLDKTLRDAAARGYDMVEIMHFDMPAEYASMGAMPEEFHRSVAHLYGEIEREIMPMAAPASE